MKLVIVESPAKAKTINKYLGNDYKVLASFGHIRDLPAKDGSVRPDEDFAMDYEVSGNSTKHVKTLADAMQQSDSIYLATDPDREGEAISWHLIEVLKKRRVLKASTPVHRVVFHEITKRAVCDAVANPRELDMDLVNAQQARRALDYLVGFTLSPVLWRKLPGSRSAGRVQSVALRLVCDREEEIEKFISREYWHIDIDFQTEAEKAFTAKLTHLDGKKLEQFDLVKESQAKDVVAELEKKEYAVSSVEAKEVQRHPKPPFTTSSLQQEASRKLGFGAKKTMMIAQKLYEGVDIGGETAGLITYMRTDAVTVSKDAVSSSRSLIGNKFGQEYVPSKPRAYQNKSKNAQEAHEAIRPTDVSRTPDAMRSYLDNEQQKLYALIWKRMMASQMSSAVLNQVGVNILSRDSKAQLRATGSTIKFDGFFVLYREGRDDGPDEDESKILPAMEAEDALLMQEVKPEQHFTQPPPRYTEASLVKKLEELGIGRPSTYASIISVLQERNYVKLDKKRFIAEDRGRIVTAFLLSFFERYLQYDFTANLENDLDRVACGELEWKALLHQFWGDFKTNADSVKELTITEVIHELNKLLADYLFPKDEDGAPDRSCPSCDDGRLSLKMGKFGAFLGCSNYPDCRYTKQLNEQSGEDGEASGAELTEPKVLGTHPESGLEISVRKGPYGFYVQMEPVEGSKDKPKRASLNKGTDPMAVTLEQAVDMLALPRVVGTHPETGKEITAGVGRFGPYLKHNGKFTSLKEDNVLTIGMNRAVAVLAEAPKKAGQEPLKVIGKHPDSDDDVVVMDGRYGAYVKYKKTNATIPKDISPEDVTMEQALEWIAAQANKKKSPKKKAKKKSS